MALGVALISVSGCGKGGSGAGGGSVVAVVNGTPITQDEYLRYMMLKPSVQIRTGRGAQDAPLAQPLGFQALNDLVKQKLLVQMAKQQGVYPTDTDVQNEIKFQVDGDPNFVKNLTAQGLDTDMIKQALAVEMSQRNLITKGITVTDADIEDYQKKNPKQFIEPTAYDIDWILVKKPEGKKQVDDELRRGQDFAQTAMRFSESQNAKEMKGTFPFNHLYGTGSRTDIPYKEISEPISKTPALKTTDWISAPDNSGFAKFYVASITPEKKIVLNDHQKEVLRRLIKQQRGAKAQELGTQILEQQRTSKVDVKLAGLQEMWDNYIKQLSAASAAPSLEKTVNTATGGTTAGAGTAGTPAPATTAGAPAATAGTTGK